MTDQPKLTIKDRADMAVELWLSGGLHDIPHFDDIVLLKSAVETAMLELRKKCTRRGRDKAFEITGSTFAANEVAQAIMEGKCFTVADPDLPVLCKSDAPLPRRRPRLDLFRSVPEPDPVRRGHRYHLGSVLIPLKSGSGLAPRFPVTRLRFPCGASI